MRSARKHRYLRNTGSSTRIAANLTVCLAVLVLSGLPTSAATISNRDDKDQKITIIEGETKNDSVLKPLQVLEKICLQGCVVRLNDSEDDDYQIEPDDVVSIEDGYLYHDAPEASVQPPAAAATPPAKK